MFDGFTSRWMMPGLVQRLQRIRDPGNAGAEFLAATGAGCLLCTSLARDGPSTSDIA